MMPDWLTPALVEQAAQMLREGNECEYPCTGEYEYLCTCLLGARAVLDAVGPAIYAAAQADVSAEEYEAGWAERGRRDKASIEALSRWAGSWTDEEMFVWEKGTYLQRSDVLAALRDDDA